jgi:hypothetical protein
VALALSAPSGALAADINVNREGDGLPTDPNCRTTSTCTLRDAVALATPNDVVRVPPGQYILNQGEISLVDTTIVGAGALVTTIDGNNQSRVLRGQRGTNSVAGVTITRGNGLGLQDSGGGAIRVDLGTFTLIDSTVASNVSPGGAGGILVGVTQGAASLELIRSTVAGNVANAGAAASQGGGIFVSAGATATLTNSTISGNSAGIGGNLRNNGTLTLNFVTVTGDLIGGGISQAPPPTGGASSTSVSNSIVAGGSGAACSGTIAQINSTSGSHNVVDDTTCALGGSGDRENVDPALGGLTNNGGPTSTHALLAGSPAIGAANPAGCAGTDQRGVARPQEGTCDAGAFELVPTQAPPSQPPPPGLPPPVLHEKFNAIPARGTIRVKRPGAKRFRKLADGGAQLPVGTTVDALKGRVTIVAASDGQGGTDTALFYGGIFKIGQTKGKKPTTILSLTEKLSCPKAGSANIAAKKKKKRRLWGDGEGKFRTKGKHSAATVVGTKWLVQDRCKSTLTRVVRGRLSVRDFAKMKTVIVRAGRKYVARAR